MKPISFEQPRRTDAFWQSLRHEADAYFAQRSRYATPLVLAKAAALVGSYWAIYWLLVLGPFSLTTKWFLAVLLGVVVVGVAFNVAHEAAHGVLTGTRFDAWIYTVTFQTNGLSAYLWRMKHLYSHHTFTNVVGLDVELEDVRVLRLSPTRPWQPWYRYQHLYVWLLYAFFTLHWVFVRDFEYLHRRHFAAFTYEKHSQRALVGFWLMKAVYLFHTLGVPVLLGGLPFRAVLIGFLTVHVVSSLLFTLVLSGNHHNEVVAFAEAHSNQIAGSWARNQVATALDFSPLSPVLHPLLGGLNAHVAHHLFPKVSHAHYRVLTRMIQRKAAEFGVPYHQTSFWGMVASHYRHLKRLGQPAQGNDLDVDPIKYAA